MKYILLFCLILCNLSCQSSDSIQKPHKITLVKFGILSEEYCSFAEEIIQSHYQLEVNYSDIFFQIEDFYLAESSSYAAIQILDSLNSRKGESPQNFLAVNHLPIRKVLKDKEYPVVGLAYTPGCAALVSTYWMNLDFPDIEQLKQRFQKVVLHELGHNFGLEHCSNKACYMQAVENNLQEIDSMDMQLCDACKKQLNVFFSSK